MATAEFDDDALPEAVDKFLPLIVHDGCQRIPNPPAVAEIKNVGKSGNRWADRSVREEF